MVEEGAEVVEDGAGSSGSTGRRGGADRARNARAHSTERVTTHEDPVHRSSHTSDIVGGFGIWI